MEHGVLCEVFMMVNSTMYPKESIESIDQSELNYRRYESDGDKSRIPKYVPFVSPNKLEVHIKEGYHSNDNQREWQGLRKRR